MNDNKNAANTATETAYDRAILERQELVERIVKLQEFIKAEERDPKLPYVYLVLLKDQLKSMKQYYEVLDDRIARWKR